MDAFAFGINFFVHEIVSKRLALLRELVPKAAHIALLVNPGSVNAAEATLKEARDVAPAIGRKTTGFKATTAAEIDAAFAAIAGERADALLVGGDSFFFSRCGQFATLSARDRLPMVKLASAPAFCRNCSQPLLWHQADAAAAKSGKCGPYKKSTAENSN